MLKKRWGNNARAKIWKTKLDAKKIRWKQLQFGTCLKKKKRYTFGKDKNCKTSFKW